MYIDIFKVNYSLCHVLYLVSEGMLSKVMDLDKLHAALRTNVRPHVLVLHQVVLQLAAVGEGLLAFCALVCGGALMAG